MTAKSTSEVDQSTAGGAGVAVGADQQSGQATGGVYSEGGHKAHTDVNTEESISTYNQFAVQRALKNQDVFDNLSTQLLQNAIETANMVSKQAVRHADLATDRIWNINETDAYSVAGIKAIADLLDKEQAE